MAYSQRTWLVVCFLLCEILTGSDSRRLRRQAPDGGQDPSLQLQGLGSLLGQVSAQDLTGNAMDLGRLMHSVSRAVGQGAAGPTGVGQGAGQSVGQGLDLSSVMEMANALQQNPEGGVRFRLNNGPGSDDAMMEVFVETQSLDDLTRSEAGRRQLGQLNAQLEQAVGSLRQGVHMMQSVPRAQQALEAATSPDLQAMLGDIARMFSAGGLAGNDSMAAVTQLLQTVEQLPALKGLLQRVYGVLAGLETSQPSTARHVQDVLTSLASSLQGVLGEGGSLQGADSVQRMMAMAVSSLRDSMELLNGALSTTHTAMGDPGFLQTLNSTRCLLTALTDPQPDSGLALHCMQSLLHTALSSQNSEQIMATMTQSLATFLNDPRLLQSAMNLLQSPSLDAAFSLMQAVIAQLHVADTDVATAMQTAQAMLTQLLHNQQLLQALGELLQSPESAALYGEVMEMLRNATLGDPLTQQLVMVVNDTLVRVWTSGDLRQAADTLRLVIAMLGQSHDPALPLSPSQQTFLDLLNTLLDMVVNATDTTTPTTTRPDVTTTPGTPTPIPTTPTPPATATVKETTVSPSSAPITTTTTTTPQPATTAQPVQTTSTTRPEPSSPAPATTRRSDTVDDGGDNGGVHVSFSAVSVLLAVLVSTMFV